MNNRGVMARVGSRWTRLLVQQPVSIEHEEEPAESLVCLCCTSCGGRQRILAPVRYHTYDDDHYGRIEVFYGSDHAGTCTGCGARLAVGLSYTKTWWQLDQRFELALDGVFSLRGAVLDSCPAAPPDGVSPTASDSAT
jgi:hypothetical protein